MSVRLVNCFEVPDGDDETFLARWRVVNAYMTKKPGYLNDRLHRSVDPAARFRYVNYVEWESAELYAAAHDDGFRAIVTDPKWGTRMSSTAALYDVVHEGGTPS